ncbi:M23 family metallopeptidase [Plantactinospora sp. GCM10030261]|uniref:M23 family metallopeptidase n=1 Tax=Plantactinospora sp. GCM10030261 TaxID=3273420 RepID=UPI003618F3A1
MVLLRRMAYRLTLGGVVVLAAVILLDWLGPDGLDGPLLGVLRLAAPVAILLGVALNFLPGGDVTGPARAVHPPVTGRWMALNSPATKVPSHGTRAYGQTYAIDLVYAPADRDRPIFGTGPGMRPATDYPAFGEPVLAMVSGTVVRVRDGARDHRSRSRMWSLLYLLIEGSLREFGGAGRVIGNHVVIDAGDGCFALVAHLQRGSTMVREGDRVQAGQPIGRCGNSGNTTEPHVHAQLMDRASASTARGLPMSFADISIDDGPAETGLPANQRHLTALPAVDRPS